jgi:VWFA-related protein
MVASALAVVLSSQAEPASTSASVVQLDVVVHDARGRTLEALTPDSFRVGTEDEPFTVVSSRFVPAASPSSTEPPPMLSTRDDERAAARRPGARVVAFYLDEYHVTPAAAAAVRDAVATFIRERTVPGDLLLVHKPLDSLLELRLTLDRAAALAAVASFEGRRGDYAPRNRFEREMIAGDPARIDDVRAHIAMSAIQAMTTHLAQLPDTRKAFVVVGEGFALPSARRGGAPLPTVDGIGRIANRHTVSIYAADPSPDAGAPRLAAATANPVRALAVETGGRVLPMATGEGLAPLSSDLGGYYLLTVSGPADGRFHAATVRVTQAGAQVRTRRGFWTASADELVAARLAAAPPPPRRMVPPVRTSRLIRPWFGQSRGEAGRTRVTFVWEPAPSALAGMPARGLPPSRLVVQATAEDGSVVYDGVVEPVTGDVGGAASLAVFDVPPGRVRLRMSIEDAASRVLDTDVRDVLVGGLAGPVVVGTPAVFRTRTARAFNALVERADAAPSASREFSRVERLLIRLPIYTAAGPVSATAALVNRAGQAMRDLPVDYHGDSGYIIDLPLASLAAGEYAVSVRAASGQNEVRETISFRVTP